MPHLSYTKDGAPEQPLSAYQPPEEVKELFSLIKGDYETGQRVLETPYQELNGKSVIERMNEDQKAWLSWNPPASDDSEADWRWTGVRPITRNKIISTAAHLTSQLIKPTIFAQNDQDENDRDVGYVMETLLDYNIQHSNYELAMLYGTISALVNPVAYFEVEFAQSYQELARKKGEPKRVIDDEMSGFQFSLLPPDEVLISNAYEFSIKKQDFVVKRRRISREQAEAIYGEHDNWQYVRDGVQYILGEDALFYDIDDIEDDLVEEVRWMHRKTDREVVFVNGVYLSNENTKYNPFRHRTNKGKPRYPIVKFGAEPIDSMRFYFYKSLVAKMSNDQELYDRMWQLAMDATFVATLPPIMTIGAGRIDKTVVVPATVTDIPRGAQITPLTSAVNPANTFIALQEIERSLSDSSQDVQMQGQQGQLPQTARQSILLQQNAETNLTLITRMIGTSIKDVGELMVDDIIRYQTTGEAQEILAGVPRMKFKSFITHNKVKEGKNMTEHIRFTDKFAGKEMTKEEVEGEEDKLFEEAGEERVIYEVNPSLFAKMNYFITVDYEQMTKKNSAFERALKLETYDRAIQNPFVDQQMITRDFLLEPLIKGEASKYMKQVQPSLEGMPQGRAQTTGRIPAQMMSAAIPELTT